MGLGEVGSIVIEVEGSSCSVFSSSVSGLIMCTALIFVLPNMIWGYSREGVFWWEGLIV